MADKHNGDAVVDKHNDVDADSPSNPEKIKPDIGTVAQGVHILGGLGNALTVELGGSGMNTARAAAKLGAKCAFMGLVGMDEDGFEVRERLEREGIQSCLYDSPDKATGRCTVLVTPDGERTLQTFLGASSEYTFVHAPIPVNDRRAEANN